MHTLTQIIAWIRLKHTSLTQAAAAVIGAGQVLGWWTLSADAVAAIMTLVGVVWLLIGANTVTSNLRLTGKAFGAPSGVDVDKVAAHALGDLGPIPAEYHEPPPVDLSDAAEGAGLG